MRKLSAVLPDNTGLSRIKVLESRHKIAFIISSVFE